MIQDLSMQITAVEEQIADIRTKIEVNEAAIKEKQDNIDSLKKKVSKRLVEEQKTMRTYQFLEILMGAQSFEDFIRLAGGINDIYAYDSHSLSQLNDGISELEQMKEELLNDRQFSLVLKCFAPWLPKAVRNGLLRLAFLGVKTPLDF